MGGYEAGRGRASWASYDGREHIAGGSCWFTPFNTLGKSFTLTTTEAGPPLLQGICDHICEWSGRWAVPDHGQRDPEPQLPGGHRWKGAPGPS